MKIIAKFAFVALVVCFIAMGGVEADAQACDAGCVACMQACGSAEGECLEGCGSIGGPTCIGECQGIYHSCYENCYNY